MNMYIAKGLLGLESYETSNIDAIKRQYRIKALLFHPDKNKSTNASNQFRDVHEAYKFLSNNIDIGVSDKTYMELLSDFLKSNNTDNELFHMLLNRISQACEEKTLKFLKTIDQKTLVNLYKLIVLHADILHISPVFIQEIDALIKREECFILTPKLTDIMNDNIYKLIIAGKLYLVPLWHHKLTYDNSGVDLHVICKPSLPHGITIDHDNNITVERSYTINAMFEKERHEFLVGDIVLSFDRKELQMREHNIVVIQNAGLAKIHAVDMYNVVERSDVIINIHIVS